MLLNNLPIDIETKFLMHILFYNFDKFVEIVLNGCAFTF